MQISSYTALISALSCTLAFFVSYYARISYKIVFLASNRSKHSQFALCVTHKHIFIAKRAELQEKIAAVRYIFAANAERVQPIRDLSRNVSNPNEFFFAGA